jgi:hypothetical protein
MAYLKKFSLPRPDKKDGKYIWYPTPRISRTIPWGYTVEDDPTILIPIPEQLDLLEEAIKMKKRYSYRELANWLTTMSGRYISYSGLMNRIKNERRRKNKAARQREVAKKLEKALAQIEELENRLGGAKTRSSVDSSGSETSTD